MSGRNLVVNGVRLSVESRGEDRRAILFIHGFPLDRSIWHPQVSALTNWRRIAPDLRGMGQSEAPETGYAMGTYAEDLAQLLDALGVKRAVLCGLSMGGYVAFECLRRWPERVAGLVLMDTRAEPDPPGARQGRDAMIAMVREQGAGAVAEAMLPRLLRPGTAMTDPGLVEQVREMMAGSPVAGVAGALVAMRDRPDSRPLLPTLGRVPTLVLVGREDVLTPPDVAQAMADAIPGAEYQVIGGAAHLPTLEQPELTTERLRQFLDRVAWDDV
jgi:3-oxoadipate enol-lactonase